jgi:hypothetical protein
MCFIERNLLFQTMNRKDKSTGSLHALMAPRREMVPGAIVLPTLEVLRKVAVPLPYPHRKAYKVHVDLQNKPPAVLVLVVLM